MLPNFDVKCGFCEISFFVKRKRYLDAIRKNKDCNFFCTKKCNLDFKKNGKEIICENCGKFTYKTKKEIDEGAKFCSLSCSAQINNQLRIENGFETTKNKLKELNCSICSIPFVGSINSATSVCLCDPCKNQKALNKRKQLLHKNCKICNANILVTLKTKYCDECRKKVVSDKIQTRINDGFLFSKSIKCKYLFQNLEIKCDSKLEYVCLYFFEKNFPVLEMKRSDKKINYLLDNKRHNYFPDFEIILKNNSKYLVECKGIVGQKLSDKWNDYNKKSIQKRKVLFEWCNNSDYLPFWFDQQEHNKLYNEIRKTIPM